MDLTSRASPLLEPGALVDHFRVVRLLGRGGMGEVYLARDTKLGRKVALKLVRSGALGDGQAIERFLHEARTTAQFNHPNIVTVYGVGEVAREDGTRCPYVALELVEGATLRERLEGHGLGAREAMRVGLAIAEALAEAHRHDVLHRDLKPENVVVGRDGRVRVLDFGLAKLLAREGEPVDVASFAGAETEADATAFVSQGARVGTPAYMAPEQWKGGELTPAVDVWALGLMLHELLSGAHPYAAHLADRARGLQLVARVAGDEPVPALAAAEPIPGGLADLVAACVAKDPRQRPSSADVVDRLRAQIVGEAAPREGELCPFRGLLPFTEQQADLFFGRDAEVARFVERLRERPILPVVGPSGAGKSSFVQAGVIPRLREQGSWIVISLRPGRDPFESLAARIAAAESDAPAPPSHVSARSSGSRRGGRRSGGSEPSARSSRLSVDRAGLAHEAFARLFAQSPGTLALQLQQLAERHEAGVLLFVDQLEELFTLSPDAGVRAAFVEALCGAADDPGGPVRVVFTLRDDFLWRLAETEAGREALSHVTVLRSPDREALEETLTAPLRAAGYDYDDPELVREMVAAVKDEPAALTLLQFMGELLWERRDRDARRLLRAVHDQVGGVAGALARQADEVLAGLSQEELELSRALFLRLVTAEGTRRVPTRRSLLEGLDAAAEPVLDRLLAGRLLVARKGPEGGFVELVHESLARSWDRLRRWLEESREEVLVLAEVRSAAELWDKRGRREDEAWQGAALRDARRGLSRAGALPEIVASFLAAGDRREQSGARRRRRLLGGAMGGLALLSAAAVAVAFGFARKEKQALVLQAHAEAASRRAVEGEASALCEGARAALEQGEVLEARAKVRMALESEDSLLARVAWWRIGREPLVWRRDLGALLDDATLSADGTSVAAAGDRSIFLLDAQTGAVRVLRGSEDQAVSVAFSPDGRLLAAGLRGGPIDLWDLRKAARVRQLVGHQKQANVEVSPDGRSLASAGEDGTVRLWDVGAGTEIRRFVGHEGVVMKASFSPDGRSLASAGLDKTVRIWDVATGREVHVLRGHEARVTSVAWSPDGKTLASSCGDKTVRIWDGEAGAPRAVLAHDDRVYAVAFSPLGTEVASGTVDGTVRVFRVASGQERWKTAAHASIVTAIRFGPDGTWLATTGYDKLARRWDLTVPPKPPAGRGQPGGVSGVAFRADGKLIAASGTEGAVRLFSVPGGKPAGRLEAGPNVTDVRFAGERVVSGGVDKVLRVWDVGTGAVEKQLAGHASTIYRLDVTADGARAATVGTDGSARLWDLAKGVELWQTQKGGPWEQATLRPDGSEVAFVAQDGAIRLFDTANGREKAVLRGHDGAVRGVDWSPDGQRFASSGDDGTIRLWDAAGKSEVVARGEGRLYQLAFHPDGDRVGVGGSSSICRIASTTTGRQVLLRGHRGECNVVRFGPDGKLVVTGSDDTTVRLWDADTGLPMWRAPLWLPAQGELHTHDGWLALDGATLRPTTPAPSAWRRAVEERAVTGAADPSGTLVCFRTAGARIELWDRAADRRLSEREAGDAVDLVATREGCFVQAGGAVVFHPRSGEPREIAKGATALAPAGDEVLVASGAEILVLDARGERRATQRGVQGAAAVARVGGHFLLGFTDGSIERVLRAGAAGDGAPVYFEQVPSNPVVRIVAGPRGTIAVSHADGSVGLWRLDNGTRLDHAALHGAAVHLELRAGMLVAASELGDHLVWDLTALERDPCDLLREVWRRVPFVWVDGLPVRRDPPTDHGCAGK